MDWGIEKEEEACKIELGKLSVDDLPPFFFQTIEDLSMRIRENYINL